MPGHRRRLAAVGLVLALGAAGCSDPPAAVDTLGVDDVDALPPPDAAEADPGDTATGDDGGAAATGPPSTTTTTTAPTTTTSRAPTSTSTTGPADGPVEVSDTARSLAELHVLGALLLEEQQRAPFRPDPIEATIAVYDDVLGRLDGLTVTPATQDLRDDYVVLFTGLRDLFVRLGDDLASPDPDVSTAAALEYQEAFDPLGRLATDTDAVLLALTADELGPRTDPAAVYAVGTIDALAAVQPAVQVVLDALTRLATDPEAVAEMLDAVEELSGGATALADLTPPPSAADLHRRQVEFWEGYGETVAELGALLDAGEAPSFSLVLELQGYASDAQELNAERQRFLAAVLIGRTD